MERLLRSALFASLSSPAGRSLAQVGRVQALREGSPLMQEGEASSFLAVLLRGRLSVLSKGQQVVIADIPVGAPVGELGLLTGAPRSATVVASEPSEVWRVERSDLEALLEAGDPRAGSLLSALGRVLVGRLRDQHLDGLAMLPGLAGDPRGRALLEALGWGLDDQGATTPAATEEETLALEPVDLTALETVALEPGQRLFSAGEVLRGAFHLETGALTLRLHVQDRRATCTWERAVAPGDWLGLSSMLDGGPALHSAVASAPSTLRVVSRDQLALWLDRGDPRGLALQRQWLVLQARELARVSRDNVRILRQAAEF